MGRCLRFSKTLRLGAFFRESPFASFLDSQSAFFSLHGRLPTYFPFIFLIASAWSSGSIMLTKPYPRFLPLFLSFTTRAIANEG